MRPLTSPKGSTYCSVYVMFERTARYDSPNRGNEGQRVWTGYIDGWGYAAEDNKKLRTCYMGLVAINAIALFSVPITRC